MALVRKTAASDLADLAGTLTGRTTDWFLGLWAPAVDGLAVLRGRRARVKGYVSLLTERFARQRLRACAQTEERS